MPITLRYFSRREFACRCGCGFDALDAELLYVLTQVRKKFGPVIIGSGCRCKKHNKAVEGSKNSQHCFGKAVDFCTPDAPVNKVADYLRKRYPDCYGIGEHVSFIHFDVRSAKWRKTYYPPKRNDPHQAKISP